MTFRVVNGSTHTEDGWRCCNRDECDIVRIPELYLTETAPLRKGAPLTILGAWLYWYDRNVEEILTSVWGWSLDNDVLGKPGENNGSNHLSGTAVDVNAPKYPWGNYRMPPGKIAKVEQGLRLFEGSVFWGRVWSKPDEMHYQMSWREGDGRNEAFAQKLLNGHLGIYQPGPPPPPTPVPDSYGLPPGSNSGGYGGNGVRFPDWVYQLGNTFGVKPSTYPGHQETDRNEAGYAPNPQRLNRGIDWAAPGAPDEIDKLTRFADYLATIPQFLEQVIWQSPTTGRSIEVAGGRHQPGYFAGNLKDHRNHVHTRQSRPIPIPGAPPPPPPPPPPASNAADVLARAAGIPLARAQAILPQVSFALRKANCTNPRRIAAALAQWIIESGHFVYTEEIADGPETQERWKYKGRTWIQLTWLENYKGFSEWCHSLNLVPTPDYFVARPRELAEQKWAALGPAYWWAIKYPRINEYADRGDIDNVSKWVNAPAWVDNPNKHANHEAERRAAYNKALALGDQLLVLTATPGPQPPPPVGEDELSAEAERKIAELHEAFFGPPDFESLSPLREPGEGKVGNLLEFVRWMDANVHVILEIALAKLRYPDPDAIALLNRVAATNLTGRERDSKLAKAILQEVGHSAPAAPPVAATAATPVPVGTAEVVVHQYEPEVLPAVQAQPVRGEMVTAADQVLGAFEFAHEFNKRYQQAYNNLAFGELPKKEEPQNELD